MSWLVDDWIQEMVVGVMVLSIPASLHRLSVMTMLGEAQVFMDSGCDAASAFEHAGQKAGLVAESEEMKDFVAYGLSLLK